MSLLLDSLANQTERQNPALDSGGIQLSYAELEAALEIFAERLRALRVSRLAFVLDNGIAWVLCDLAARRLGIPCIPLPSFFTAAQLDHALKNSGADLLLHHGNVADSEGVLSLPPGLGQLRYSRPIISQDPPLLPAGCAKITYTAGSTGQAKGVCLSEKAMLKVAQSLYRAAEANAAERHLCVLPLSLLLANISAVYAPLLNGGCCYLPSLAEVGLRGSQQADMRVMAKMLHMAQADSSVMLPQMLQGLLAVLAQGDMELPSLRFLAVGGAPVARTLLNQAETLNFPVFEGYGLSEAASVVSLNTARESCPGSVGKPLPHATVELAPDNEILVSGTTFLGYMGESPEQGFYAPGQVATGDFGEFDETGFLHLRGRKKTCFITSFGRNVAPEWIEQELIAQPAIASAVVDGEALPCNLALIQARGGADDAQIAAAVAAANRLLPDYAQVGQWFRMQKAFSQSLPNRDKARARLRELAECGS